jgi:hypothetical protein
VEPVGGVGGVDWRRAWPAAPPPRRAGLPRLRLCVPRSCAPPRPARPPRRAAAGWGSPPPRAPARVRLRAALAAPCAPARVRLRACAPPRARRTRRPVRAARAALRAPRAAPCVPAAAPRPARRAGEAGEAGEASPAPAWAVLHARRPASHGCARLAEPPLRGSEWGVSASQWEEGGAMRPPSRALAHPRCASRPWCARSMTARAAERNAA